MYSYKLFLLKIALVLATDNGSNTEIDKNETMEVLHNII